MKTYTLTLTREQVQIIANALAEMPFKFAAPVVGELNKQITEQDTPTPMAEAAE